MVVALVAFAVLMLGLLGVHQQSLQSMVLLGAVAWLFACGYVGLVWGDQVWAPLRQEFLLLNFFGLLLSGVLSQSSEILFWPILPARLAAAILILLLLCLLLPPLIPKLRDVPLVLICQALCLSWCIAVNSWLAMPCYLSPGTLAACPPQSYFFVGYCLSILAAALAWVAALIICLPSAMLILLVEMINLRRLLGHNTAPPFSDLPSRRAMDVLEARLIPARPFNVLIVFGVAAVLWWIDDRLERGTQLGPLFILILSHLFFSLSSNRREGLGARIREKGLAGHNM